jgi:hypothetical protein
MICKSTNCAIAEFSFGDDIVGSSGHLSVALYTVCPMVQVIFHRQADLSAVSGCQHSDPHYMQVMRLSLPVRRAAGPDSRSGGTRRRPGGLRVRNHGSDSP